MMTYFYVSAERSECGGCQCYEQSDTTLLRGGIFMFELVSNPLSDEEALTHNKRILEKNKQEMREKIMSFSTYKCVLPQGISRRVIEEGTVVYDEGEPFILDEIPYKTFLVICQTEFFYIRATSIQKAIDSLEAEKLSCQEESYSIFYINDDSSWEADPFDNSKRNAVINHIANSLFDIDIG